MQHSVEERRHHSYGASVLHVFHRDDLRLAPKGKLGDEGTVLELQGDRTQGLLIVSSGSKYGTRREPLKTSRGRVGGTA